MITGTINGSAIAAVGILKSYSVAGFTDAGSLDTHTTTWQVLNISNQIVGSGTGLNFNFTPSVGGTFTVIFTVVDDDGGSDSESLAITVLPPVSFDAPIPYGTDATSGSVVSGDFNRDGILDVAATAGGRVNVFLGHADGTFDAPQYSSLIHSGGGSDLVTADLTGDGILDIAVPTYSYGQSVEVLKGNGDGTFTLFQNIPLGINNSGVVAADFDDDGDIDLASSGRGPNPSGFNGVAILRNDGNTGFTFVGWVIPNGWPVELVTGDFNEDGITDLATADYTSFSV